MAIYKNGELQRGNKNAPDSVRAHILSDARISDSLTDYIAERSQLASVINAIISIVNLDDVYDGTKVTMIKAILEGVQE